MALTDLQYTFRDKGTSAAKRIQSGSVIQFQGYNCRGDIEDGEMRNMKNLCADEFPALYQRSPRGTWSETPVVEYVNPYKLLVKSHFNGQAEQKLAVIDKYNVSVDDDGVETASYAFYYDGVQYLTGLSADTKMVAINTKICFFPEKKYFKLVLGEGETNRIHNLESSLELNTTGTFTVGNYDALNYVACTMTFPTDMSLTSKFVVGDVVTMNLTVAPDSATTLATNSLSAVIVALNDTSITFPDNTFNDASGNQITSGTIKYTKLELARPCPDLDFVMESNNRIWGCSNVDNTIYACKLGDPTNWQYYQGTSVDSYYAEQGSDGEWTGCAPYGTHLLFFKEDCIHKVYGSYPAEYQTTTTICNGVEKGSSNSIAFLDECIFYKSRIGIMAYGGGTPTMISPQLGNVKYKNAVAGTDGRRYYVSMADAAGEYSLFVFDTEYNEWHRQDDLRVRDFAFLNGKVLYITETGSEVYEMDKENPQGDELNILWSAELGPFDEYDENKKIYSKLKFRYKMTEGSVMTISIATDEGEWEELQTVTESDQRAHEIELIPRRCDCFSIKLEGRGYCKVKSMIREFRQGSGRKDG